jgi:hypothetical protein
LVALKAGFPSQARAGFKVVLESRALTHQRLASLGGDVRAAARLGLKTEVTRIDRDIRREAARGGALLETTMAFVYLAEAQHLIGDSSAATATLSQARQMAAQHGFNEYAFAADALERSWESGGEAETTSPSREWSEASSNVSLAINRFAALT